ncbi:hypothetical protein [Stenotrophomonas rhizophila]|uniref:hypothetical protein n=1 Tax=Stenotrophomonas rhizophila TaxID=216778 RepID=UPI00045698BE|nr:hypothetical protein [Stenotrophomonas rhizophila]AHY59062.1 hypothetical protein DX03_10305 [Stenotrophomonas rhizophila]
MAEFTPHLSIDLKPLPAGAEPWLLEPMELNILRRTLDETGDFQQPYAALEDLDDADAGSVDANVEVSSVQLDDGPPAILIEDDGAEDVQDYLVLEAPWRGLPAGTLLHRSGQSARALTVDDTDPGRTRALTMLVFLDLLMIVSGPEAGA